MPFEKVGVEAVVKGVNQYVRDANRVTGVTGKMSRGVKDLAPSFRISATQALRFGAAIVGVQLGISVMSRSIIGLQQSTIGAAIAFESSFAGIRKTMNLTEEEFDSLARANRDLAKTIPVTVNELNRIGELAGQLGVVGVPNVLEFEETIAKLAVTTDLTADSAALAFAQIANVIQLPQDQFDNLAAAVVGLGNTFPALESNIVALMQRLSGAAKLAGITAGELTGIATAFASVGAPAEAAGSAAQRVLFAMTEAAIAGGRELTIFAAVTETTAEQFAALVRGDPAKAFTLFVEGLGTIGEDAIAVLDALGLADIRVAREFLKLAGAGDLLGRAIKQGTRDFEENIAANEEAAKRFETTASKLQLLRNSFADIGIEAGDALLLGLEPLLEITQDWIDTNGDQFARDLADAIEGGIEFAADLADEIGRLASFLQTVSEFGPIEIALDIAELTGKDKLVLTLAAAVLGGLTFGPGGALILGGVTLGGLVVADLFGPDEEDTLSQLIAQAEILRKGIASFRAEQAALGRPEAEFDPGFLAGVEELAALDARISQLRHELAVRAAEREPSEFGAARPPFVAGFFPEPEEEAPPGEREFELPPDPEEVEKARLRAEKAFDKLIREAERARAKLRREALSELTTFGDLVVGALRARHRAELDDTLEVIDEERDARREAHEDRLREIDDERDAKIDALRAETDATIDALNAQIAALDEEGDADERARLERDRALAFEEQDVFEADQALRAFDRRQRQDSLRDQIRDVRDTARDRERAIRNSAADQLEIERDLFEDELEIFNDREEAARESFEQITEDWRLNAEARRLIAAEEFAEIAELLREQGGQWRDAGVKLGEQLAFGAREGLEDFIRDILGTFVLGGPTAVAGALEARQLVARLQAQGRAAKAAGASENVLGALRSQLLAAGIVPQFQQGGLVGPGGQRVPIIVEPGEIILNPVQQAMLGGGGRTVFERGAFEGMLAGASFAGSPRENARAIRDEFDSLVADQLGRGAFISGAGG